MVIYIHIAKKQWLILLNALCLIASCVPTSKKIGTLIKTKQQYVKT